MTHFRKTFLFTLGFALTFGFCFCIQQITSAQTRPLTYSQIITALNSKLPLKSSVKNKTQLISWLNAQIKLRKVDKPLTAFHRELLLESGATNELIETIKVNSPPLLPTPVTSLPMPSPVQKPVSTPVPTPSPTPPGTVRKNSLGMELVWIPPGRFMMGSTDLETDKAIYETIKYKGKFETNMFADEKPKHEVVIKEGFWMGKFEVTQAEWQNIMGENPSKFKRCGAKCPVEQVSWNEIQVFLRKMESKDDQFNYNLPTESEWEYAARAGSTTTFASSESLNSEQANFKGKFPYASTKGKYIGATVPVGNYQPNGFGLYDMIGNVEEWVQDVYNSNYINLPTDGTANISVGETEYRVLRGGAWNYYGSSCRSASRNKAPAFEGNYQDNVFGFRVVARRK